MAESLSDEDDVSAQINRVVQGNSRTQERLIDQKLADSRQQRTLEEEHKIRQTFDSERKKQ